MFIPATNNARGVEIKKGELEGIIELKAFFSVKSQTTAKIPWETLYNALYSKRRITDISNSKLLRIVRIPRETFLKENYAEIMLFFTPTVEGNDLVIIKWKDLKYALELLKSQ